MKHDGIRESMIFRELDAIGVDAKTGCELIRFRVRAAVVVGYCVAVLFVLLGGMGIIAGLLAQSVIGTLFWGVFVGMGIYVWHSTRLFRQAARNLGRRRDGE